MNKKRMVKMFLVLITMVLSFVILFCVGKNPAQNKGNPPANEVSQNDGKESCDGETFEDIFAESDDNTDAVATENEAAATEDETTATYQDTSVSIDNERKEEKSETAENFETAEDTTTKYGAVY